MQQIIESFTEGDATYHQSQLIIWTEFTEFYNPQYGEMDWQCDYCGEIFRSDDEVYMDYWEQQGIKCILPALENNLAII